MASVSTKDTNTKVGDEKLDSVGTNTFTNIDVPVLKSSKSVGIRKAEILFDQYSHPVSRTILYFSIFIASYVYSLDSSIRYTFQSYATSSYAQHSLLSTVNVIIAVAAAASQPMYARLSDKYGRLEIFVVAIMFYAVGTVIESQAFDVKRYAAGAVLFQIGYSGVVLILQIMVADFSNLNWRLAASSVTALPFIINTWISGNVSSELLKNHSWNYCIGIWAFIFPLSCIPLIVCLIHMLVLARKTKAWQELVTEQQQIRKTWGKYFIDLFNELDIIGILLVLLVFGFILVPFTIAGGISDNWKKASTIAPLVIGFCFCPVFIVWEAKYAKHPILPYKLLSDRGVWAAMIIAMFIDFVWYMPNDYLYTVLVVGMNQSINSATRITNIGSFVSVIVGPLVGLVITRVRRTKGFIMFGVATWLIAMGLLVKYRGSNDGLTFRSSVDGVIGANALMGFGTGFFTYTNQVSIASCTSHEYMAVVVSISLSSYNIGSALGSSLSGAVWTNLLYKKIRTEYLAAGLTEDLAKTAYSSPFEFILDYPWGSLERIQLVKAYAEIQKILCIIGLCLVVPMLAATFFLRDHKLPNQQSLELEEEDKVDEVDKNSNTFVVLNKNDDDVILKKIKSLINRK